MDGAFRLFLGLSRFRSIVVWLAVRYPCMHFLDDSLLFRRQADVFTSQAAPWDHMNDDVAKFETSLPSV